MFYLDTQTNKRYIIGTPFVYGGQQYTSKGASHETFLALGFQQVIPQQRPNENFYVVTGPANDGSYTATPRDLAILKTEYKKETKQQAFRLIQGTDWYVIRLLELGATAAAVPTTVSTFRSDAGSASDARCAQIDACTSVAELEALITAPDALTQFPEKPETGVYY